MKKKIAIIFGITGQDGSYLAELLLNKNYIVYGVKRRTSLIHTTRIDHIYKDIHLKTNLILKYGDVTDFSNVFNLINEIKPDEIYNLAAQSHVAVSFEEPEYTANSDAFGVLRILEAIRILGFERKSKFYQSSTSELFGLIQETPQTETTPFYPRSPYGVAKMYGHWITKNYREAYGIFASNGILFNHESPRRGETFVTRKIVIALCKIKKGLQKKLYLGNIEAKRDWGHAKDYVEAMWLMLQQDDPDDYVIATNETHTVREFLEETFSCLELDYKEFVGFDQKYERPAEVDLLIGDASKAEKKLGWKPQVTFKELVSIMVEEDMKLAEREKALSEANLG